MQREALNDRDETPAPRRHAASANSSRAESARGRACALWYAPQTKGTEAAEPMLAASSDLSPVLREISLFSLAEIAPTG